jgi:hypothetical protein
MTGSRIQRTHGKRREKGGSWIPGARAARHPGVPSSTGPRGDQGWSPSRVRFALS